MIKLEGYPVEEHTVLTDDGYLLRMHRIPGGAKSQAVFLQHGILASSFDWVLPGKEKGLGNHTVSSVSKPYIFIHNIPECILNVFNYFTLNSFIKIHTLNTLYKLLNIC